MATVVPAPAGTGNIAQSFAIAGGQFGRGIGQFLAQRQAVPQLAQLFPNLDLQGITRLSPQMQEIAGRLGLQRQAQQALPVKTPTAADLRVQTALQQGLRPGTKEFREAIEGPPSPAEEITKIQLDRIRLLQRKAEQGTITKQEKAELRRAEQLRQPRETFTPLRIEQTKGHLEAGGETTIFGNVIPFIDRKSAINYVRRQLGPNWEQAAPEAKEIIDRKWPSKTKGTINVISPGGETGSIPVEDWKEAQRQGFKRR